MNVWICIAILALGSTTLKAVGPVLTGGRTPPPALTRVIALLAPALIAALVVTGCFVDSTSLVVDPRAGGFAVGALALWLRAPLIVALVLAASVCAGLRLVT